DIIKIQQNNKLSIICNICKEEFEDNEKALKLNPCKHLFHEDCIMKWFVEKFDCPSCRSEVKLIFNKP
ncbi:RING-type domain-containing protein, partial [Meloidogyne graminicola]